MMIVVISLEIGLVKINTDYFNWLHQKYGNPEYNTELFKVLANTEYKWQFVLDSNRASAGLLLRTNFAYDAGVYQSDVAEGPCSVLEMLCALAEDMCRECGQYNAKHMFVELLMNLGLDPFKMYHEGAIKAAVDVWLNRKYMNHGFGNIFFIPTYNGDLKKLDTWTQMTIYLNYKYPFDENFLKN